MILQNQDFDDDDDEFNPEDDGAGRNFHFSRMHLRFLLHYNTFDSWNFRACQTSELTLILLMMQTNLF